MTSPLGGKEPGQTSPAQPLTVQEKRTAMWCHLSSLAGLIIPGANILAPLFCWLSRKDTSRFVNFHGKESLNFQINMLLYSLFACPFCCAGFGGLLAFGWTTTMGQPLTWGGITLIALSTGFFGILAIYEIIISVLAGVKANEGEWYRYPWVLFRFFK